MQTSSTWRAIVYARRSNWAALNTNWSKSLVLGDRSIVTSYVTRWRKWLNSPSLSIRTVDLLESAIPAPDLVFYLDAPHELLMERLQSRGRAIDIDETPKRSMAMRKAYDEIIVDNLRPSRLANTRFVRIPVSRGRSPEDIASEIVATIVANLYGEHHRGSINRDSVSIQTG
jgi:thymidylate kinase